MLRVNKFTAAIIWLLSIAATSAVGVMLTGATAPVQQAVKQAVMLGPGSLIQPTPVPGEVSGHIETISITSKVLHGEQRSIYVYLPPDYTSAAQAHTRYPTIYLLHGTPGDGTDWLFGGGVDLAADKLISTHAITNVILVMPMPRHGTYWNQWLYANKADGTDNEEDYLIKDLVPFIDAKYRTIQAPRYRAVVGASEGGFGAAMLTLRHPDLFSIFVSMSGFFTVYDAGFGNKQSYKDQNSPLWLARHAPVAEMQHLHALLIQASIADFSAAGFYKTLQTRQIGAVEYHTYSGIHRWSFWSKYVPQSLQFCDKWWGQS